MAESFPPDEFDDRAAAGLRAGAHRQRPVRGRRWIIFLSCTLAAVLIALGGFAYLNARKAGISYEFVGAVFGSDSSSSAVSSSSLSADSSSAAASSSPAAESSSAAVVDYGVSVVVLNATSTTGLAASAAQSLDAAGFATISTGNASSVESSSYVAFSSEEYRATAEAVAQDLGISVVSVVDGLDYPVTVVLGLDFVG